MTAANYGLSTKGCRLFDLVRSLSGVEREDFLAEVGHPCLLQVPLEGGDQILAASGRGATKPFKKDAMSTVQVSLKELENLKRSKRVESALVHMLEPSDEGAVVLGRSPECDVVLDLAGLSRRHAEIKKSVGRYMIVDLDSHNGTYLNGKKIPADEPTPIEDRANVWLASYRAIFLLPEQLYDLVQSLSEKLK